MSSTINDIPGLILWLDPFDKDTITIIDEEVDEWRDKSGCGNDVVGIKHVAPTCTNFGMIFSGS